MLPGLRVGQLRALDHHRDRLRHRPGRRQRCPARAASAAIIGDRLANSFNGGDASTGTLTSPDFTISQDYLNFLVGGGNHPHVPGSVLDATPPPGPVFADFEGDDLGPRLDGHR